MGPLHQPLLSAGTPRPFDWLECPMTLPASPLIDPVSKELLLLTDSVPFHVQLAASPNLDRPIRSGQSIHCHRRFPAQSQTLSLPLRYPAASRLHVRSHRDHGRQGTRLASNGCTCLRKLISCPMHSEARNKAAAAFIAQINRDDSTRTFEIDIRHFPMGLF